MIKEVFEHSNKDRFVASLSYLGSFPFFILPLFLIPLLLIEKEDIWIRKHAKQGFIFYIGFLLIPWYPPITWPWGLYLFICWVIITVKILLGAPYWKMPIIGNIADKINI